MRFKNTFIVILFAFAITGCKKINDNNTITDPNLAQNLEGAISANLSLSIFNGYVKKTGIDILLQSSKTYTVWAPTNDALASLDPSIVNDTAKLRSFVLNHIANETYFTKDVQTYIRVPMLSGKYNNFFGNKIEDANLTSADNYTNNGVLHIIDKPILVLPNVWDYINSTSTLYTQNAYIASLYFQGFNPATAVVDSISSLTGLPVYHPGTGIVIKNTFTERLPDVRREDKQYTYFIIANASFSTKADSLKPYFKTATTTATDSLDKWNIVKDLLVDTLYPTTASLPNIIFSKFGVPMPINKSLITDTKKLSNGVVYFLSASTTPTAAKLLPVRVEGENPSGFLSDKTSNTNFQRIRKDSAGIIYTDLLVSGHGVTSYYSYYRLNEMPSTKYNVYARAVNDFQTAAVFESLNPGYVTFTPYLFTPLPTTSVQYAANTTQLAYGVPLNTAVGAYNEVFLGSFTSSLFGTLEIRLVSGTTTINATGTGPIVLDYFRLVPVP